MLIISSLLLSNNKWCYPLYLQRVHVSLWRVVRTESQIPGESDLAAREDVEVGFTDPRNLEDKDNTESAHINYLSLTFMRDII